MLFFMKLKDNSIVHPFRILYLAFVNSPSVSFWFYSYLLVRKLHQIISRVSAILFLVSSSNWSLLPPSVMINMIKLHCFLSGILMWWFGGANKSITVLFDVVPYLLKWNPLIVRKNWNTKTSFWESGEQSGVRAGSFSILLSVFAYK